MTFDQLHDITAWMADAGIDELELSGPSFWLRLGRGQTQARDGQASAQPPGASKPPCQVVTAPTVGVFLHRHPLHAAMLAPEGARVKAGQALGLLRIGSLLVPVTAPSDGIAGAMLIAHETVVGYGTALVALHPLER
ncbi:biotin attachment protein [Bradyrhizobium sp. SSBR45G]|uniref:acetyl-CoA carboxylase biotin carboxyl carrier protein n=1 Tax=unclassified Bradyrhizobium TaxID=2631580 RepID=UPI002342AA9F|nr:MULTISPECIES: biotin attachment protein [unclassified Bradyrhizobium]GLH76088.1 biotin attachment protein [Bradyrhizobium sp. SSBR45G]GLH83428.1 biotin attachment protein [Bradyrhizobium sp. SSBR45R]